MKNSIIVLSLFLSELFLTFYAITGIEYGGGESSPIFTVSIIAIGFIILLFLLKDTNRRQRTSYFYFFAIIIPLVLIVDALLESASGNNGSRIMYFLKITLGYIIPISITAIYISKDGLTKYSKYIHLAMLLITFATALSVRNTVGGMDVGFGGANYQTLSYYSALAFCLNLCFILNREQLPVFSPFNNRFFHFLSYVLLVIQLVGCLMSGGRGGFVFLAVCSLYMLLIRKKVSKLLSLALFSSVIVIIISSIGSSNMLFSITESQMERTFSYITKSGIDFSQTSNRDEIYDLARQYIDLHLYNGGGLFNSRIDFGGHPHNFFLEVLMQGGIFYCLLWVAVLIVAFIKMHYLVFKEHDYLMAPIVMYPTIMLLFSGTYLWTPLFWFFIAYTYTRTNIVKKVIKT